MRGVVVTVAWLGACACGGRSLVEDLADAPAPESGGTTSSGGSSGSAHGGMGGTTAGTGAIPTGGTVSGGSPAGGASGSSGKAGASGRGGSAGRPPLPEAVCAPDEFCAVAPELTANYLTSVWGTATDDVWVVGARGTILHYDGSWLAVESGTNAFLTAVSGTSETDVWFVGSEGTVIHYDGFRFDASQGPRTNHDFIDVAAVDGEVWLTASGPRATDERDVAVFHFDGNEWQRREPTDDRGGNYGALFANAPDDVWLAGDHLFHFDGEAWQAASPFGGNDVWAEPGLDAWFTYLKYVEHLDGGQLQTLFTSDQDLFGIWGASESDLWAVGSGGVIVHRSSSGFLVQPSPTDRMLRAVWGTSTSDVWAVGEAGTILHYDGSEWSFAVRDRRPEENVTYTGIWGATDDEQWLVGKPGVVSRFDGVTPPVDVPIVGGNDQPYRAITGELRDDAAMVGADGRIAEFDGEEWFAVESPVSNDLLAVWMTSPSKYVAVGQGGAVRRTSPGAWQIEPVTFGGGFFEAVWGAYDEEYWVSSSQSTVLGHYHSGTWETHETTDVYATALWGYGQDNVWGVGGSSLWHYDGTSWARSQVFEGEFVFMNAMLGCAADDVWAVGYYGDIRHYDGTSWTKVESGTTNALWAVRCSPGGVWVVGEGGIILRLNAADE